jgi:N,N'-diacetyllegionaminate synthase
MTRPLIIAELASGHAGDMPTIREAIRRLSVCGADVVKFQSHRTQWLDPKDPQFDWLTAAQLSDDAHKEIRQCCREHGIEMLTTVFDPYRVDFLAGLGLASIKIGSGEAMDQDVLRSVVRFPWRVYVSTGLATYDEIDAALQILAGHAVVLMHTTSEYPTIPSHARLDRIHYLRDAFRVPVGYSDHTVGLDAAGVAIAMGAAAVEVHVGTRRVQPWDKSVEDMAVLCAVAQHTSELRQFDPLEAIEAPRPFIGRWQYGR